MLAVQPLTKTQATRLRNYINASAVTEPALSAAPTMQELAEHPSCTAALLGALDVAPARLLAAGATLEQLTAIGYGANHLVHTPGVAVQMATKYGKAATAAAMLRTPQDAVVLSTNTLVTKTLGLSTKTLLDGCQGDQASGVCVIQNLLQQHREAQARAAATAPLPPPPPPPAGYVGAPPTAVANLELLRRKLQAGGPLVGVGCETLLRLGLDGRALQTHFGIQIHELSDALGVSVDKLQVLGVFERPS